MARDYWGRHCRYVYGWISGWIYYLFPQIHSWYLFAYNFPDVLLFGVLLGFGEGLGDAIKSFFKRRLNIASSMPFFPFDQFSFLGALILGSFYYVPSVGHIFVIVILSPIVPVFANLVAFKLGWKKVWW